MKYAVKLTEAERARLRMLAGGGAGAVRMLTHARILLKVDRGDGGPGWTDAAIAEAPEVQQARVGRVRRTYVEAGLDPRSRASRPTPCTTGGSTGAGSAARRRGVQRPARAAQAGPCACRRTS